MADRAPQPVFEAMELGYNAVAMPRLLRAAREQQVDLIYERYAFFNLAGALASRRLGIPFVVEVNELAGYERVRDQSFVGLARAVERMVLNRATLIVTVSQFLSSRAEEITEGKVPVVTVPNGVSAEWLASAADGKESERLRRELGIGSRPVACFVGGLTHWHNFGLLLSAMRQLEESAARGGVARRGRWPLPRLHRGGVGPPGAGRLGGDGRARAPRGHRRLHRAGRRGRDPRDERVPVADQDVRIHGSRQAGGGADTCHRWRP